MQRLFVVLLMLCPGALQATPTEAVVESSAEGQQIIGTLVTPEGPPAPVVLLLHGFVGSRDELPTDNFPNGVFAYAAARLAEAGFASLRLDFRGSGDSIRDMSFAETTFETQIADALAGLDYLSTLESVRGDQIYLIGWSLGGLIAATAAGRSQTPKAVALWNGVADPQGTFGRSIGIENLKRGRHLAPDEALTTTLSWGPEISLQRGFFEDVATLDPLAEIAAYPGALLVIQGLKDTQVLPKDGAAYHAAHQGPGELWTSDMGHSFDVFETDETYRAVVDVTIAFFQEHLE
ncbi:MAG: alpha/beta fold hydrolase [Pseudomonadota bacterium]